MSNINWPVLTDYVILFAIIGLVLYNITAGVIEGGPATISARMQHHGYRFPIIVGLFLGLAAHWWWPVFGLKD